MRLQFLVVIPFVLSGTTPSAHAKAETAKMIAPAPVTRTVDDFRFIDTTTTLDRVTAKLGAPERDIGSGIYIYMYRLADGSYVLIGSTNGSQILYVRHGQDVLFDRGSRYP